MIEAKGDNMFDKFTLAPTDTREATLGVRLFFLGRVLTCIAS